MIKKRENAIGLEAKPAKSGQRRASIRDRNFTEALNIFEVFTVPQLFEAENVSDIKDDGCKGLVEQAEETDGSCGVQRPLPNNAKPTDLCHKVLAFIFDSILFQC